MAGDGNLEEANNTLDAQLEAVLAESAILDEEVTRSKRSDGAAENHAQTKSAESESAAPEIARLIAKLPCVKALDLHQPAALNVLTSWYAKQQAYVIAVTQLADLIPERKQAQQSVAKIQKLLEAARELEGLKCQIDKELGGRKNKAALENLSTTWCKREAAVRRLVQGTGFSTETVDSKAVLIQSTLFAEKLKEVDAEYSVSESRMAELLCETEELEKAVRNVVKRGYHQASLQHHPDKLGEVSEQQNKHWRLIQNSYKWLSETDLRREYFDMRNHETFAAIQAAKASGAVQSDVDTWQKRLCGAFPHQCTMPMLCEENEVSNGEVAIKVIWTCRNAVSLEVTRYEVHCVRSGGEYDCSYFTSGPELTLQLKLGEYTLRARAFNVLGAGCWSQPLVLVLEEADLSDAAKREASKNMMRLARSRAREHRQCEARADIVSKMSTLACRHSLAYENLSSALASARKLDLPLSDDDKELFARAQEKLEVLRGNEEARQNMKDWKKKVLPFPAAELVHDMDSNEVSANVSNMMMQHLCKKAKELVKAPLLGADLRPFDDILASLTAAQMRSDVFKPSWCQDFQDLARKHEVRIEQERKRRAKEKEKMVAKDRECVRFVRELQGAKLHGLCATSEEPSGLAETKSQHQNEAKVHQEDALAGAAAAGAKEADMDALAEDADDVGLLLGLLLQDEPPRRASPAEENAVAHEGVKLGHVSAAQTAFSRQDAISSDPDQHLPSAPQGISEDLQNSNAVHAKPFTQIDLGSPPGMQFEALCVLDAEQVTKLLGYRGTRLQELVVRFPKAAIELSVDDGMLHVTAEDERMCTRVLELARIFASQPLAWDTRQWCVCMRCQNFADGCVAHSKGVMHWWVTDEMVASFMRMVHDFCGRFPSIHVRIEPQEKARYDGRRLLVIHDTSAQELHERVRTCLQAAAISEFYIRSGANFDTTGWCVCGKCQTQSGCVGHLNINNGAPETEKQEQEHNVKTCNICFENECDKRVVPCLHPICSECIDLVRKSAVLTRQDILSCPFCRIEIKGFVDFSAKGSKHSAGQLVGAAAVGHQEKPSVSSQSKEQQWLAEIVDFLKKRGGQPIELGVLANPAAGGVMRPESVDMKLRDLLAKYAQQEGLVLTQKGLTKYVSLASSKGKTKFVGNASMWNSASNRHEKADVATKDTRRVQPVAQAASQREQEWLGKIVDFLKKRSGQPVELGLLANPQMGGVARPEGVGLKLKELLAKYAQTVGLVLTETHDTRYVSMRSARNPRWVER
jgi:hypothetical protein